MVILIIRPIYIRDDDEDDDDDEHSRNLCEIHINLHRTGQSLPPTNKKSSSARWKNYNYTIFPKGI